MFRRKRLRFLAHCHRAWSRNFVLLLLLIFLQEPVVLWGNYHRYLLSHIGVMGLDSFLVVGGCFYFVAILCAIPNVKIRQRLIVVVLAILTTLFAVEVFTIMQYRMLFGEGLLTVILETNFAEATEYLYSVRKSCLLIAVSIMTITGLCYLGHQRWAQRKKILPRKILVFLQPEIIGAFIAALYIRPIGGEAPFDLSLTQIISASHQTFVDIAHYEELSKNLSQDVRIVRNESNIPYVVLILGESTQRNFMHIYGYSLPNTPNLDVLANNGELAIFRDIISAKHSTVLSLREIFTFHDYESICEWYDCNNLLDVLREAGYTSWWLSNQDSFGVWANTGTLFANRADHAAFTQRRASQDDFGLHDEALFPLLDNALCENTNKNFYVLHLMGCHVIYNLRYPEEFAKFTKANIDNTVLAEWKADIAAYANAVLYNDFIVSNIIERFRGKDAIVIYVSDHGENVHDDGTSLLGHAYGEPNRYLYEIPMLIWTSEAFRQNHASKWTAIQNSVSRPFMTDDLIHALLGVMDIQTVEYNAKKDLFSAEFDAKRRRIVSGKDYDGDLRNSKIKE